MEERTSGIKYTIRKMATSVKEYIKYEVIQAHTTQEMWMSYEKKQTNQNLGIIGIEEEEETKLIGTENNLKKFIEESSLNKQIIQTKMIEKNDGTT